MGDVRVELIPILKDNYVFLLSNESHAVVVDPGEATAVQILLKERKLFLEAILITHHHADHIGGLQELRTAPGIYAPEKNRSAISSATHWVNGADVLTVLNLQFEVLALPGHTLGHIAYYCREKNWLFSGDVLFGLGCGRLFEGTPAQQYASLSFIKELPGETQVFCTHEYTSTNLRFCYGLVKQNLQPDGLTPESLHIYEKKMQMPTVPLLLADEKIANPFLLAKDVEEFARLRQLRNEFV